MLQVAQLKQHTGRLCPAAEPPVLPCQQVGPSGEQIQHCGPIAGRRQRAEPLLKSDSRDHMERSTVTLTGGSLGH